LNLLFSLGVNQARILRVLIFIQLLQRSPIWFLLATSVVVISFFFSCLQTWTNSDSLSEARSYMASAVCRDTGLFVGGTGSLGISAVIDIFNSTRNTWTTVSLSQGRYFLAAACTDVGQCLIVGGLRSSGGTPGTSDKLDLTTGVVSAGPTIFYSMTKHQAISDGKK
jgi:hypothetical protein